MSDHISEITHDIQDLVRRYSKEHRQGMSRKSKAHMLGHLDRLLGIYYDVDVKLMFKQHMIEMFRHTHDNGPRDMTRLFTAYLDRGDMRKNLYSIIRFRNTIMRDITLAETIMMPQRYFWKILYFKSMYFLKRRLPWRKTNPSLHPTKEDS